VRHRWSDITVATPTTPPVEAIVVEAERRRAGVIVVGSRGLGYARRLMLGSVSRGVVRRASSPVLVVKGRRRRINRLVLATDGSLNARRALDFVLARLEPPAGARVNVLRVLEPVLPNTNLLPAGIRRAVLASAASLNASRTSQARREVEAAAVRLKRDGWRARGIVREGVPLAELLREVVASRADLLVVGARGTGGLARLLLGSVAEGALDRSPVPVVLVK
jgi:nucleotide-binding universal stress UspA family protein